MIFVAGAAATRVLIDLRATGPLAVLGHDLTLTARAEGVRVDVGADVGASVGASAGVGVGADAASVAVDALVEARFAVTDIDPPAGISSTDRAKMRENLLSRDVLDARRHPAITLRGRYAGNLKEGTLRGDLVVRGVARAVAMPVRAMRDGERLTVTGRWEGRLTDLGIKPFKALLGALKLEDWIVLRLEARLTASAGS